MTFLGIIVGAFASLLTAAISATATNSYNDSQQQFIEKQNDITREREDSAYQRAVADAQAAGFSPLVAAGTSAGQTSTPIQATGTVNPAVAFDGIANVLADAGTAAAKLESDAKDRKSRENIASQQISASLEQLKMKLEAQAAENASDRTMQDLHFVKQLEYQQSVLNEQIRASNEKEYLEWQKTTTDTLVKTYGGVNIEYSRDLNFVKTKNHEWLLAYKQFVDDNLSDAVRSSKGSGSSTSGGANLGVNVLGSGANLGGNSSIGSNQFSSDDRTVNIAYKYRAFCAEHPYYVYVPTRY
ncbi:DNA pilot protein [Microvirus D_HF38_35]|nr:DNA pilot protein [Microvirus D_HF38_35]